MTFGGQFSKQDQARPTDAQTSNSGIYIYIYVCMSSANAGCTPVVDLQETHHTDEQGATDFHRMFVVDDVAI